MQGEQRVGRARLRGQRSEGLSAAQVSVCCMLAPGQRGDSRDPRGPTLLLGLHKQDRLQHCPCDSAHKPEFKARHSLGMSILAADGSGFGLKARDELKINSS